MAVESEAVAPQVAPGVPVKVEGMEGTAEAGLEVAQQDVDSAKMRQVLGCLPPVTKASWWQLAQAESSLLSGSRSRL